MRLTLDVELAENELSNGPYVQQALERLNPNVKTRMMTDKAALTARVAEAIANQRYDTICSELLERLSYSPVAEDCLDVVCNAALFSVPRAEKGAPAEPFVAVIARLPEGQREKARKEVVQRAMTFLSTPRRTDCSRVPLLPYAETLAAMTKTELLSVRSTVYTFVQMIRYETTRTAGMTCMGKLVEMSYEAVRKCEPQALEALRASVASAQQDDTFLYDVEYIMEAFGWSQNKSLLSMARRGANHAFPILSLAYHPSGLVGAREVVVTSSVDGAIGTWDASGNLTENVVLSRHYAASMDLANRGHSLIVGIVGRQANTPPAVIIYVEDTTNSESRWIENQAVEPKNVRFITGVKTVRSGANSVRFGVGMSTTAIGGSPGAHSLHLYDSTQLVQEYQEHADMITALHAPADRENTIVSGSRDRSVMIFDLRSRQAASCLNNHVSTVTSIGTCSDYIITGGLDKRVVVEDLRMLGHPISREMDSAVLSLSVNSTMQCAVSTLTGVYVINYQNGAQVPTSARADCGYSAQRYNTVAWNQNDNILYAGGDSKTLDVFRRVFPDGEGYEN